ncbi:MAG: glycosyltransferase family 2 protein [Solirubrobacteraceae bacterium]
MTTPRTTVVVPVWGGYVALRFEEALASIVGQDVPVSVLVIDNASHMPLPEMDGVVAVMRTAERVPLGTARNIGLAAVETETVMFADADDVLLPGTLRRLQQELDGDQGLVAVAMPFLDADTGSRHRWPRPWIATLVRYPIVLALVNAVWGVYPITGPVLIRTQVAREVGGHADVDNGDARCLGAAMLFRGRVGWIEQPGWIYYQREGSNSDRFSGAAAILESARSVRERLATDFGGPGWLAPIMPLLAVAQWAAVAAHLAVAVLRRTRAAGARFAAR